MKPIRKSHAITGSLVLVALLLAAACGPRLRVGAVRAADAVASPMLLDRQHPADPSASGASLDRQHPANPAQAAKPTETDSPAGALRAAGAVASPDQRDLLYPAQAADGAAIYLPRLDASGQFPDGAVATALWDVVHAFVTAHPPQQIYPGYHDGPSASAARLSIELACHDFPRFQQHYDGDSHRQGCYVWVPEYLGVLHGSAARRIRDHPDEPPLMDLSREQHLAWAVEYLALAVEGFRPLVYGPETLDGPGWRDSRVAVWQNPHRLVETAILAELLRQEGALTEDLADDVREVVSAAARAWKVQWHVRAVHPSHGVTLHTGTKADTPAVSLAGHPVVATTSHQFSWDADKGNTPAEEVAWMGAGAVLSANILAGAISPQEEQELREAGHHYLDLAWPPGRHDPAHGGTVRTLNLETSGGPYGQRPLWIENHTEDTPSVPYLGWLGLYLGAGMMSEDDPWPSLVENDEHWNAIVDSAEATLHAPDGTILVDLSPGSGLGFAVDHLPEWHTDCANFQRGHHYIHYDGRSGGPAHYVSEIGHPGGLDLLTAGWSMMRFAAARSDAPTWHRWRGRLMRVTDEYRLRPPDPATANCGVAPYVSKNPGYHWGRMVSMMVLPHLGMDGFTVARWGADGDRADGSQQSPSDRS